MTAEERLINGYSILMEEEKMTVEQVPEDFLKKVYVEKIKAGEMLLADVPETFRARVEELVNAPEPEPTYTEQQVIDSIVEGVNAGD